LTACPTTAYLRDWHRRHATCPGWAAASNFAAGVGPRREGYVLALLGCARQPEGGTVATCGTCAPCRASGASRNVRWIVGQRGGRGVVLHGGVLMTRAAAAARIGISRQALAARLQRKGDPMRPRAA